MSRCHYFQGLWKGAFSDSNLAEIPFPQVTLKSGETLLRYLYTDQVTLTHPNDAIQLLLDSSQFLGFERLRRKCEEFIGECLDIDSICWIYSMANNIHASKLRALSLFFIMSNWKQLRQLEEWKEMDQDLKRSTEEKVKKWGFGI